MIVGVDTKQRILDVAEQQFAEHGFEGTSLRGIIAEAEVNLAAIHYHFRSKEGLLEATLLRRIVPLNEERVRLLDQYEKAAVRQGPELEEILFAFLAPPMRLFLSSDEGRRFGKMLGRLHSETGRFFLEIAKRHFGFVAKRFRDALSRAAPGLPPDEVYWRMHFAVGVMAHTLSCSDQLEFISEGLCKVSDADSTIPRLVDFVAAGFRAPVPRRKKAPGKRS